MVYLLLSYHALFLGFEGGVICPVLKDVYKEGKPCCLVHNLVAVFMKLCCLSSYLSVQVIIEGFKSYREEITTEPFSPKVNVVGKPPLPFPHKLTSL